MATKLIPIGVKRKELYPQSAEEPSKKDYNDEIVRPEIRLTGAQAEMMGAEDLKKGDRIRQTVEWVVTDHVKREANGKPTEYEMTLCLDKASDCTAAEGKESDDAGEADDSKPSRALAYIQGQASPAE